jgi:hypothetical protein
MTNVRHYYYGNFENNEIVRGGYFGRGGHDKSGKKKNKNNGNKCAAKVVNNIINSNKSKKSTQPISDDYEAIFDTIYNNSDPNSSSYTNNLKNQNSATYAPTTYTDDANFVFRNLPLPRQREMIRIMKKEVGWGIYEGRVGNQVSLGRSEL